MVLGKRPDSMRTKEFIFVQHSLQYELEFFLADERKHQSVALSSPLHARNIPLGDVGPVVDKPIQPLCKTGKIFEDFRFKGENCKHRDQPDE